ncbi:S-methyl-5-thioribose-1-phosphate isomerase [Pseudonocardiaceae bacterium YIM PH 21723]|nr:S-methyl-5-thioribose-1-phosphate isomerase [Pseudonocardiaceae bacterium YIM PH 21723]
MTEYSLTWDGDALIAIDQRSLPHRLDEMRLDTVDSVIEAIRDLAVRGAPAIGVAGAFAVAIAAREHGEDLDAVRADAQRIAEARPTAVNLSWAVRRVLSAVEDGPEAVLEEALALRDEDVSVNRDASTIAADFVQQICPDRPLRVLTHCNTGRLATVAIGTAIGTITELSARGRLEGVLVDETRPLLQGARLTAWELAEADIPHRLTVDSAAAWAIATGEVDVVLVGADRIAANGDVANKIGTYGLALAAKRHGIPFVVVAPESTRDTSISTGAQIVVEQRADSEVTEFAGEPTAPEGTEAYNPAFDVTPADLVTAVVTELGVIYGATGEPGPAEALAEISRSLYERGWMPGTAGNLSVRLYQQQGQALITGSGRSKGELTGRDMVRVWLSDSRALSTEGLRPSAETSIHTAIYRTTDAGAVVHVHAPSATALSVQYGRGGLIGTLEIADFELIKGFGLADPSMVEVPVFPNWPDVARIAEDVERYLVGRPDAPPVLLIAGHGLTTWGETLAQARDRAECLEALCQLVMMTGRTQEAVTE